MIDFFSKEFFGILAIVVGVAFYGPYLLSIYKGKTKPHLLSWILWSVTLMIGFVAQWSAGGGAGAWVTGVDAVLCGAIALLAIKYGERHITFSDKLSFIAALSAIPVWLITKDPLFSVMIIAMIDVVGMYPTFRKSYLKPYEEVATSYLLSSASFFFAILALESYSLTTYLYPATIVIVDFSLVIFLLLRRRFI